MHPRTTLEVPAEELSSEAQFALAFTDSIDVAAPAEVRDDEERQVLELVHEISDVEEQLLVLRGLYTRAHDRKAVAEAIEASEDLIYGDGVIEVATLEDLAKATERVLKGKNAAVVVRAGVWGEQVDTVGDTIPTLLESVGTLDKVGVEKFPKPSMRSGSSLLHIDNFIYDSKQDTGFRFTLSAAQIETGHALFIGGPASRKAQNVSPKTEGRVHPYEVALERLESDPKVQRLYATAQQGRPKLHSDFVANEGTHIVAEVLNPGDTVIWGQGGPGCDVLAWHAFRQIGEEDRTSTSYHYVMQSPTEAVAAQH